MKMTHYCMPDILLNAGNSKQQIWSLPNQVYSEVGNREGNGNPFQYSCLGNPVDRGAWWAAVHRVAQSWTRLERLSMHACMHWRRKWQPTPVFLPGESQEQRSLVGCHLWGYTESDATEVIQQQQQGTQIFKSNNKCHANILTSNHHLETLQLSAFSIPTPMFPSIDQKRRATREVSMKHIMQGLIHSAGKFSLQNRKQNSCMKRGK